METQSSTRDVDAVMAHLDAEIFCAYAVALQRLGLWAEFRKRNGPLLEALEAHVNG